MIRKQYRSIGHGKLDVACNHNIFRLGRGQVHQAADEAAGEAHGVFSCSLPKRRVALCHAVAIGLRQERAGRLLIMQEVYHITKLLLLWHDVQLTLVLVAFTGKYLCIVYSAGRHVYASFIALRLPFHQIRVIR